MPPAILTCPGSGGTALKAVLASGLDPNETTYQCPHCRKFFRLSKTFRFPRHRKRLGVGRDSFFTKGE